ncbi:MAG: DUF2173 family protein [Candidatus Binatia bacterium]
MTMLDDLLKIPGTVAAGESTPDGQLVDYRATMEMSPELAATAAKFITTMTMIYEALASAYSEVGEMSWVPQGGWMYSGGEWTVAVSGSHWSICNTAESAFSQLYDPTTAAAKTASLGDMLSLGGAVAAGEYSVDGKSVGHKATLDMPPELAAMAAQFCAAITMMFRTLSAIYTGLSKMTWLPAHGWLYSGGDWTIAVSGSYWTMVRTAEADFNELYAALVGRQ